MLAEGYDYPMLELPRLALEPTAALCERARTFLGYEAELFRSNNAGPTPFGVAAARMQRYLPAMQWLVDHRCDIGTELTRIEAALREFAEPASPEYRRFLSAIQRLQASR